MARSVSVARVAAGVLVLLLGVMAWQHHVYWSARRNVLQDAQALLHSSDVFHVVTFVEIGDDADPIDELSRLVRAIEAAGGELVYAGRAAFTLTSPSIGEHDWDAALLVQYASRQAYDQAAADSGVRDAFARLPESYSHGTQRAAFLNLMVPQALLGLWLTDVVRGRWSAAPLEPAPYEEWNAERRESIRAAIDGLRELRGVNDEALLVFNVAKAGTAEQQEADRAYGLTMLRRMAAGSHGPMHVGRAVVLEGDAEFEQVVLVYYPGPGYFADLIGSSFFHGIIGDKRLADNQSVPTVPIRSLLR